MLKQFQFSILVAWLSHAIEQCKCTSSDKSCSAIAGWNVLLGWCCWVGVQKGGMSFYFMVLFMGFFQQNTVTMIVYILVVLCNEHTIAAITKLHALRSK
jgi:hypothetical protein